MKSARWFIDAFCGSGKVGNELLALKQSVFFLDRVLGPRGDLCSRSVLQILSRDARMGKSLGSILAPPCSSHSRIQQIAAAGPLRTPEHPLGVPGLDGKRLARVELGNATAQSCAYICRAFLKSGVPFIVENPALSFLWLQPVFVKLLACAGIEFVLADQCLYGTEWRKRTGFLCGNIPTDMLTKLACRCKSSGGRCDRTGLRHRHLIGSAKGGGSMTSKAQNYPPALAKLLAGILLQAAAMRC